MTDSSRVVIIGAGHAGIECAAQLREKGFEGRIRVASAEPGTPYQRPPLSKDYLKRPGHALPLRPQNYLDDQRIELITGKAERIDRSLRRVHFEAGIEPATYDHLVLATGARNRRLSFPGSDDCRILELRTLADAEKIAAIYQTWSTILVIGGGFIGLEMAGLLAQLGKKVIVVEAADRLMRRATTRTTSEWLCDYHRKLGVQILLERQIARMAAKEEQKAEVLLSDGTEYAVDAVLLAAGVLPNTDLAEHAGLETKDGIIVDRSLRTSDPAIYAIGDCARFPTDGAHESLRLESVQNAHDQGRTVAAQIAGVASEYSNLPWFWSVQGSARLQIAGVVDPAMDQLIRGDLASGKFSVFLFQDDRLKAVESINSPGDHVVARKILSSGQAIAKAEIADIQDLKFLLAH